MIPSDNLNKPDISKILLGAPPEIIDSGCRYKSLAYPAEMKDIVESGDINYRRITLQWEMLDICQYRCEYCYAHELLKKHWDKKYHSAYKQVLSRLKLNSFPCFEMQLVGGDPTLHPKLFEICETLNSYKNCIRVEINTNLVKSAKFFSEFNNAKYNRVCLTASYHPEFAKNDKFIEKCKYINELSSISEGIHPRKNVHTPSYILQTSPVTGKSPRFHVSINLHPDKKYWDKMYEIYNMCIDNKISVGVNYLTSTSKFHVEYTKEFFDKFGELMKHTDKESHEYVYSDKTREELTVHEIKQRNINQFRGYNCAPRIWEITQAGEFVNACTGKPLDILNKKIEEMCKCPHDSCPCDTMLYFKKTKDDTIVPNLTTDFD